MKVATLCLLGAVGLAGCVAAGYEGGPAVGVDVGYAGDFYEPYGYGYGGWGPGYRVGPPRGGVRGGEGGRIGEGRGGGRSAPSIPTGSRGGGGGHSGHR